MSKANCAPVFRLLTFLTTLTVHVLRGTFQTREELLIENLALRQQLTALKKERPRFLDSPARRMAGLGDPTGYREAGDRRQVESRPIPSLLGEDLRAQKRAWTSSNRS